MKDERKDLFGGDAKWQASDWTASDDRVRGGKSQSCLEISSSGSRATFKGNLDIKTVGGAGFASQRTASDDANWDLSDYDGVEIVIFKADGKRYTFNIKDELLPRDPDTGREQSTISYEYDFTVPSSILSKDKKSTTLRIPWSQLTPTYRGREKKDAPALKTGNIRRLGIMCRSFFGDQEGDFELEIESISAVKNQDEKVGKTELEKSYVLVDEDQTDDFETIEKSEWASDVEKGGAHRNDPGRPEKRSRTFSKLALMAGAVLFIVAWMNISGTSPSSLWTCVTRTT